MYVYVLCSPVALDVAFSSLYRDEVHLDGTDVFPTVAAASMLQLVCVCV